MTDLQLAIFEVVAMLQPNAYGVPVQQALRARGRELSYLRLYAELDQLEIEGRVRSRWGEATPERRELYWEVVA